MIFGKYKQRIAELENEVQLLEIENSRKRVQLEKAETDMVMAQSEAAIARAQLMQLRVAQHNDGGRIGWMVSAFIPNEVLAKLTKDNVDDFIKRVARLLVRQAVQGIFRVLPHSGRVFGLVFGPLTDENTKEARIRVDSLTGVELDPKTGEGWEAKAEVKRIATGGMPVPGKRIYPPEYLRIPGNCPVE